jgi:hypothetical protein
MSSRTLRQDVSKIPVVMEPAAATIAETFVPKPTEPSSDESGVVEPASDSSRDDASAASGQPLSERERAVLTFEKQNWKYAGAKEQAIRDRFEMSASRYYQLLNGLLDRPEAHEFEPALINRLRRLRAGRQRARSGRAHPHPA